MYDWVICSHYDTHTIMQGQFYKDLTFENHLDLLSPCQCSAIK